MLSSPERMGELSESFRYNDSNGDGRLDFAEFVNMLRDLEANVSAAEARVGFDEIDSDDDNAIEFDEFIEWWGER
ncbi:MAG: EF-hand domain-containing protein [Gammaproteobacteria bacterium]